MHETVIAVQQHSTSNNSWIQKHLVPLPRAIRSNPTVDLEQAIPLLGSGGDAEPPFLVQANRPDEQVAAAWWLFTRLFVKTVEGHKMVARTLEGLFLRFIEQVTNLEADEAAVEHVREELDAAEGFIGTDWKRYYPDIAVRSGLYLIHIAETEVIADDP